MGDECVFSNISVAGVMSPWFFQRTMPAEQAELDFPHWNYYAPREHWRHSS